MISDYSKYLYNKLVDPALKQKIQELMLQNRQTTSGYQYTLPSTDSYPYQWFWDSCFHAIILSHFSIDDAKKELVSLAAKQFENGMIPHIIFWQKNLPGTHFQGETMRWGKKETSSITQPPMLAYAVWTIYQKDHDKKFLEYMYLSLKKLYNYFLTDRDPRSNHLAGVINPDESGEDNSPRFDLALGLTPQHTIDVNYASRQALIDQNRTCNFDAPFCMKNFFWVKDVPLNAILVENLLRLSDIANELGHEKEADLYFIQSRLITEAMKKLMFEDGVYWSIYLNPKSGNPDYQKIKVKTWHIFAPLFAHIYTQKEAQMIVDQYLFNPKEFATPFMVPTVPKSEPSFDPKGFWRGPVWISTNWFIYQGLKKYGFGAQAKIILDSSIKLLQKSGFREQFDPMTGEGHGAQNFTWGALVWDMMEN